MSSKPSTSILLFVTLALLAACAGKPAQPGVETPAPETVTPSPTLPMPPAESAYDEVYDLVSEESLFTYLEALTAIQPYSGWRNSASQGEAEALDLVEQILQGFTTLQAGGLEIERQSFEVFLATEIHSAGLLLVLDGEEISVPVQALRGGRYDRHAAKYFDSDGVLNDAQSDPATASGAPLVVLDEDLLYDLPQEAYAGRIMFIDYALLDRMTSQLSGDGSTMGADENTSRLVTMIEQGLAGVVLVTELSNIAGESQSTTVSEAGNFAWATPNQRVPFLLMRLEDLQATGLSQSWADLERISEARMTLDTDISSPGRSGNITARIPGSDPTHAVILAAHIDSPNSPGALDDGSGCAALLELARVLDASGVQPVADIYLVWFGSEEVVIYGSSYFVATHQELLDRTLAMVEMDALGLPLDGKSAKITMIPSAYDHYGADPRMLTGFLTQAAAAQGIPMETLVDLAGGSDNITFDAFDVPNLNLVYMDPRELTYAAHPIHYYLNWHSPYETVDRVRPVAEAFADMTRVLLMAGLEIGAAQPDLSAAPEPQQRALIVSTHTVSFGHSTLRELGLALSWEGFDVDLLPHGQAVTTADLEGVGIVIIPPNQSAPGNPLEEWSGAEIALLQDYVADGGFLVVINSSSDMISSIINHNNHNVNDRAMNPLLEPMGIRFILGSAGSDNTAQAATEHPLTADASYLTLEGYNEVAFRMDEGLVLYRAFSTLPLAGLVDYGDQGGQVLVVAERGMLMMSSSDARNLQFVHNIARYAAGR